jgi:DtxR family Mn-dependent transcriptional regulator
MATSTVEDYLKQLYLEQQTAPERLVAMGKLASLMGVVPGTATVMVKALADSGLVTYEPRTGTQLTAAGEQLALHVLRRHRLVELFLVKVLNLDWSEVHDEAEELEHAISDKVLERMDEVLGRPAADPHGDPIPSAAGRVAYVPTRSLADCGLAQEMRISRVMDQGASFLQFIERCGLRPGVMVRVVSRDAEADAMLIEVIGGKEVMMGTKAAAKVLVENI